jgi:hypothetical protein
VEELRVQGGAVDEIYLTTSYPFQDQAHAQTFRDGLARAGLFRR